MLKAPDSPIRLLLFRLSFGKFQDKLFGMDSNLFSADITNFLEKALGIQLAEPEIRLTEEKLKEIARNAGLSEDDWKNVCEKLKRHLAKGQNFLKFANYTDAITDLEHAAAIAPYRADVLVDCGKAHFGRWKETGCRPSRDRAEVLFTKCLEVDPGNADAAEQLSGLKKSKPGSRTPGKKALVMILLVLACGVSAWVGIPGLSGKMEHIGGSRPIESQSRTELATRPEDALNFYRIYNLFRKDAPIEFVNSLEMKFVQVPVFDGKRRVDSISFSVYETRIKDYRQFVERTNHGTEQRVTDAAPQKESWSTPEHQYSENHPVTFVNWHDARAFCEWLTLKERNAGKIGPNDRYRLPTDHEWSCAIGIGQMEDPIITPKFKHNNLRGVYPWGVDWPPETVLGNYRGPETGMPNAAPVLPDTYARAAPVGSFPLSHWGMFDLGGNVWEWCEDQWDVDMNDEKTVRGGCFETQNGNHILSAGRRWIMSREKNGNVGFRCVLERGDP